MRLGALEAGGTKMVCAIGNANGEIYESISKRRTFRHWESVALDRST